jgi:hypothetical protein
MPTEKEKGFSIKMYSMETKPFPTDIRNYNLWSRKRSVDINYFDHNVTCENPLSFLQEIKMNFN